MFSGLFGSKVQVVKENPNPKVLTIEVNKDLLQEYSKLVVTPSGKLKEYCPIAAPLLQGDVTRVDLVAREGKTYLTVARRVMSWSDEEKQRAKTHIDDFLKTKKAPVLLDALGQNITATKPFSPDGNKIQQAVQNAFNGRVNPVLATDGGAMELLGVSVKPNLEVSATVALIGSCNGCSKAETDTLQKATEEIRDVLDTIKAGNEKAANLHFSGIQIQEIPELVIAR